MCSNCVSIYSVSKVLFCKVPTKVSTNQPTNLPTFYPSLIFSQSFLLFLLLSSSHMLNKDVQDYFTLYSDVIYSCFLLCIVGSSK